jgi:hypothetical protein
VILALPATSPGPDRDAEPAPTMAATLTGGPGGHRRRLAVTGLALALVAGSAAAVMLRDDSPGPATRAQAAGPLPAAPTAVPQPECTVGFVVAAADGRFTTKVNVANSGQVPIPAASLSFTLPEGHRLAGGTPGRWRQSGRTIAARIADLAPGHDHTAVVRGTYRGATVPPGHFKLGDTDCRVTLSVAQAAPLTAAPRPEEPKKAPPAKKAKAPKPKGD